MWVCKCVRVRVCVLCILGVIQSCLPGKEEEMGGKDVIMAYSRRQDIRPAT